LVFLTHQSVQIRKALSVKVSHRFGVGSAVFDEDSLVSCAGLVPVMTLAEQAGLARLLDEKVRISAPRIKSGSANPAPKLATLIAGMCAGADCIDDIDVVRSGGMKALFDGVYAPSTVGTLLREFTFGHARQLESVLREHLVGLCQRVDLLPGADQWVFVDVDSLLRPVYGHAKQGASYGHTKFGGKQILRKGLSPLATTISTPGAAPVIAGMRLRAGKTGSGKGAGRMVAQAIGTARAAGAHGQILVRGDSAYGNRKVVAACLRAGAQFSLVMTRNPAIDRAIAAIDEAAWTPVRYPGAVRDPDTGAWISDAEVAEIAYTAFASTPDRITARLVVRRVKDARFPGRAVPDLAVSPVLHQHRPARCRRRHHPSSTRDHRNRVRRPDRRTTGTHPLRPLRRQLRLGAMRRDRPQPAACCRRPRRRPVHPRTRINPAAHHRQRARPLGPPATPTDPAPAHPLALVKGLACTVAQHHRTQSTAVCNTLTPAERPNRNTQEKLGRPADTTHPPTDNHPHK